MRKSFDQIVLFFTISILVLSHGASSVCSTTEWTVPSSFWCVGPTPTLEQPGLFLKRELNYGESVKGVTLLPVNDASLINHFLRGFTISYTYNLAQTYWEFYKEKESETGAYVVKVFPGISAADMDSSGSLPTIYLGDVVYALSVRLHPLTFYPLNGPCISADLQYTMCDETSPTFLPPPSCSNIEYDLYGRCRMTRDRTYVVVEEPESDPDIAQSVCVKMGRNLASVHSLFEKTFLLDYLSYGTSKRLLILGLQRSGAGEYKYWMDDTEVDFTAWASGEPSYDVSHKPFVFLNRDQDGLWVSGQPTSYGFICQYSALFPRRLVGGYYGAAVTHLSSGFYITKGSYSYQFRNSMDNNGRFGRTEHFYDSIGIEIYEANVGFKPVLTNPLYIAGPYMQVVFDVPMIIESVLINNNPEGTSSNKFIIDFEEQNRIITYYDQPGAMKVIEIFPGTLQPTLTLINPPLETHVISIRMVSSEETSPKITWDVIGYPAVDVHTADICELADHGCSQKCIYTLTTYKCACDNNYHLIEDGKTCVHNKVCLPSYQQIGNHCYRIVSEAVSYRAAATSCASDGATLTSIHDHDQFELLRRNLVDSPRDSLNFFIGLNGKKLLQERWDDSSWLDITFFVQQVPDELSLDHVVYLDKDYGRAWSYGPASSTTAGYICKQFENHCTIPQLSGPFPTTYDISASSGSGTYIPFNTPNMAVFQHDPNTPDWTIKIEVTFHEMLTVTGFAFSSGDLKGVQSFYLFFRNSSLYYFEPLMDKLGEAQQVFHLMSPPSTLAYYWITAVNIAHLRFEYQKQHHHSERTGLVMEVFGCPVENGVHSSHYCDENGTYYRRFPEHSHEFHCVRDCGDFWVDNTITCEDASKCSPSSCLNDGVCYESLEGTYCDCPEGYMDGTTCEAAVIHGLRVLGSRSNVSDTEEFYLVVFLETAPNDTSIVIDFDDDFYIEVQADMLATFGSILADNSVYDLSFLNASDFENYLCYVTAYSYIHIGIYNITVTATSQGRQLQEILVVSMNSANPCPTAIIISNLFSGYMYRITYISSVEIYFQTGVDMQCRLSFVMSLIWEWKMYMLTEDKPQPDESNIVQFPVEIRTDQSTLVLPKNTLSPGLYHIQARLNLTIAPTGFKLSAAASGYVVIIEPSVHVAIVGGTWRQVYVGRSQAVEAVVTSFFFDNRISGEIVNRFNWSCSVGNDTCDFVPNVWTGATEYLPVEGPEFTLPAFALTVDTRYTLTVQMKQLGFGNVQVKVYEQVITAINADIPDLIIKCAINCGQTVQTGEKLTLVAECLNCASPADLIFQWGFKALDDKYLTQELIWQVDTGTNSTEDVLVIKAEVLTPDEAYAVSVNGTTADGVTGSAELIFGTTPLLTAGQCYINPTVGYALTTQFTIQCENFLSETALMYFVYMSLYKENDYTWHFLTASYTPVLTIEMLPRGVKDGFVHHLLLYVVNQAGTSVSFIMKVTVLPLGETTDWKLMSLIMGSDDEIGDLDLAVMLEIPSEITELMTSMVPELNAVTAETGSIGTRTEMREKLMRVLSQTNSTNDELIQPMSYLVDGLLQTDKLGISADMIDDSANLTETLTKRYTDFLEISTPGQGEKTAEFLLSGISRLRNTVRAQAADDIQTSGNNALDSLTRKKELSDDTIQEQKSVLLKLAKHKYPGEEVSRFQGDEAVFMVRRDTPLSLNQEKVIDPILSLGGVSIPWNIKVLTGQDITEVKTEVILTEYDPFPWGGTELGAPVNQTSVSVSLTTKEHGEIEVTDLDTPMDVLIPINKNEGYNKWTEVFTLRVYYNAYTGEIIKNFSRPMGFSVFCHPGFSAFVKIDLGGFPISLSVLIKAGSPILSVPEFFEDGTTIVNLPKDLSLLNSSGNFPENDHTIFLNIDDYNSIQSTTQAACVPSENVTCPDDLPADNESNMTFYLAFIPNVDQMLAVEIMSGVCYDSECDIAALEISVTVTAISMACVYWEEDRQIWTNQGCVSTRLSTPDYIHCYCDRLTKISFFSASIFVLPNELDPIGDFGLFLTFFENPLVVSLVICIWLYYFILLIWARYKDRQDASLAGVTVLADNDPGNTYLYLIGVTTGWWRDAHTTARVFMFVDGSEGQSFRHALFDDRIKRFCTGAVDWFVMATPESLGELEFVTVWHDNSGDSPAWFLKCVVVHDLSTYRTWTFIHNDWLAWDRGPRKVMATLPSFSSREIQKNTTHQFFAKWTNDMREGHLWFSIFAKPLQNSFTRVQRLSCALVLLLSAMLTNIMFFGIPTDEPEDRLTAQGLVISVPLIVIGLETALVMFVINFIVINLFIFVRPRSRPAKRENKKAKENRNNSAVMKPSIEVEEDDDNLDDLNINKKLKLHDRVRNWSSRFRQAAPGKARKYLAKKIGSKNLKLRDRLENIYQTFSDRFLLSFRELTRTMRRRFNRRSLKKIVPERKPIKPCCPWRLPWWFVIFSWLVLICTALTCSYFVMLYGLKFGYTRSLEWAVSFFTSFLTSALVTQPLKVLGLAAFITLILRMHVTDEYAKVKVEKELEASVRKQKERESEDFDSAPPQLLSKRGIEAIKGRIRMEWATQELLRELILYFSFVTVIIIVAHGHKHVDTCYRATKSVEDMFIHGSYSNNAQSFYEISTVDDMWEYITGTFTHNLYSVDQGDDKYPQLCADGVSLAVGLARIRQIRKKSEHCAGVSGYLPEILGPCKSLDFYTTEDVLSYSGPWVNGKLDSDKVLPDQWMYQTGTQLSTLPYVGKYASYSGGGYATEIPEKDTYREALINSIQTTSWIDERTSAIFIEFTIYNPGKNLFSVIILSLEFLGTGEVLPFHLIFTTKLYHYGTNFETFVAVCEGLFVIQTCCLTFFEIKRLRKIGRVAYFRDPWSYAELLTVGLCVTAVAMYLQRMVFVDSIIRQMKIKGRHAFVNFFTAAYWDFVLGYVLAFLVFLVIIKVFKLFRFNRKLSLLTLTMRIVSMPLLRFACMAAVYLMAFIHVGLLVFGSSLDSYKNTLTSALTLFNFAVGVSDYFGLYSVSHVLGPFFFVLFVFTVQLILMNMLVVLILDSFSAARKKIAGQQNDYEVVDYMINQFSLAIGFHNLKKKKNKTK